MVRWADKPQKIAMSSSLPIKLLTRMISPSGNFWCVFEDFESFEQKHWITQNMRFSMFLLFYSVFVPFYCFGSVFFINNESRQRLIFNFSYKSRFFKISLFLIKYFYLSKKIKAFYSKFNISVQNNKILLKILKSVKNLLKFQCFCSVFVGNPNFSFKISMFCSFKKFSLQCFLNSPFIFVYCLYFFSSKIRKLNR